MHEFSKCVECMNSFDGVSDTLSMTIHFCWHRAFSIVAHLAAMKNKVMADRLRNKGNQFFKSDKFYEALISYNESLCFAPSQSTELALAYANRAAVLLKLNQFKHCLTNIKLARDNNYPHESKLKEREESCLELMKNHKYVPEDDPLNFFKLSYPGHKNVPSIANCLELEVDAKYGRHIVTSHDLIPGDIIAIEEPTFRAISRSAAYHRCVNCMRSCLQELIPCDQACTNTMFCNEECKCLGLECFHLAACPHQQEVWEDSHRDHHEVLSYTSLSKYVTEGMKTFKSVEGIRNIMTNPQSATIFDLIKEDEPTMSEVYLMFTTILSEAISSLNFFAEFSANLDSFRNIAKPLGNIIKSSQDEEILKRFTVKMESMTCFHGQQYEFRYKVDGEASSSFHRLFNHSCDPNIHIQNFDNKFAYIVLKPILKGEQLFISYRLIYFLHSLAERQKRLRMNFDLKCDCTACINGFSLTAPDSPPPTRDPLFVDPNFGCTKSTKEALVEYKKNCDYIKNNFHLFPSYEILLSIMTNVGIIKYLAYQTTWPVQ